MKTNSRLFTVLLLLSAGVLLLLEVFRPAYTASPLQNEMIHTILTRTVGAVLFFFLIRNSNPAIFGISRDLRSLFCFVPALLVAVNNAPLIGLCTGAAFLQATGTDLFIFSLQSFSVGLFEELAFRGYLFPLVLSKYQERSVFLPTILSSAVFAAVHLVNLFSGASFASVVLQVGYSFLIGGMCAIVLLKTRCIWLCVILHGIYNFGGTLIPTLGAGKIWDTATVTITAILGVLVLVYMLSVLNRITEDEIKKIC